MWLEKPRECVVVQTLYSNHGANQNLFSKKSEKKNPKKKKKSDKYLQLSFNRIINYTY